MMWQRKHMVNATKRIERVYACADVRVIDHIIGAAEKQYTFNCLLDEHHDRATTF